MSYENAKIYTSQGGDARVYESGGARTMKSGSTDTFQSGSTLTLDSGASLVNNATQTTTSGLGAVSGTGNSISTEVIGKTIKTTIAMAGTSISIADGAPGYGGIKIYDFPEGYIHIKAVVVDVTMTAGTGGIADAFDGDMAVGTTITAGALTTVYGDMLASTATTQAVAGVGSVNAFSGTGVVFDGSTTPIDAYLNFIIDDADINALDTLAVTGRVVILWENLGDF